MWVKYSISGLLFYAITGLEVLLFHNYSIVFVASILYYVGIRSILNQI